jgi:hypothetical protein
MYIDAQTLMWNATALTSDAASTNTYDTGAAGNDISVGEPLVAVIQVDVAADYTSENETYEFQVIQSAAANLGSADILCLIQPAASLLTVNSIVILPIPAGTITKRYLGLYFNGGGTTPTITVTAWFAPASMIQRDKNYADAITIS